MFRSVQISTADLLPGLMRSERVSGATGTAVGVIHSIIT